MKINCILLAAGSSLRFGANKMKVSIHGKPMIVLACEKACGFPFQTIFLVTKQENLVDDLFQMPLTILENKESKKGISSSIRVGLKEKADGYFFLVCDQPFLKTDSIKRMIEAFDKNNDKIICLKTKEHFGNPVLFPDRFRDELLCLKGEEGGKTVIKRHLDDTIFLKIEDEKELWDIDLQQQYIVFQDGYGND